jgi:hypothetical protein
VARTARFFLDRECKPAALPAGELESAPETTKAVTFLGISTAKGLLQPIGGIASHAGPRGWIVTAFRVVSVPLRVTSGKLDIQTRSISCHLRDGINIVPCTIAIEVLLDLADHHLPNWTSKLEAFGLLLPEIERIASIKYSLGRLEENGELLIGGADLLRYGFSMPSKSEATDESNAGWN